MSAAKRIYQLQKQMRQEAQAAAAAAGNQSSGVK